MKNILQDVKLTEFTYPCITYVLRRIGLNLTPKEFLEAKWSLKPFDPSSAQMGDIVCWINMGCSTDVTLDIINGIPVTSRVSCSKHYGVYEGQGMVSDLTIGGDYYAPRIRVRCSDPDYILFAKAVGE